MMLHTKQKKSHQAGFSLVETLVAITILLIVVVGPLSISSQTAQSTSFASEQVIASFLAQEGLEIIHKARDEEFLDFIESGDEDPWGDFLGAYGDCTDATGCGVDFSNQSIQDCSEGGLGACRLYLDDRDESNLRSRYTHESSAGFESTPYSRAIVMTQNGDEVRIDSTVRWRSGNLREGQSVTVSTYLFNTYGI